MEAWLPIEHQVAHKAVGASIPYSGQDHVSRNMRCSATLSRPGKNALAMQHSMPHLASCNAQNTSQAGNIGH